MKTLLENNNQNPEITNLNMLIDSKGFKAGTIAHELPTKYLDTIDSLLVKHNLFNVFQPFKCRFDEPYTNTNEDGTENTAYPRFLVQWETKIPNITAQTFTFGLLVALNIQQPVIKTWCGLNTSACLNLSIFNPQHLSISFLKDPNYTKVFSDLDTWLQNFELNMQKMIDQYNYLHNTTPANIHEFYGKLIEKTYRDKKEKAPIQPVLDSFRRILIDKDSGYYGIKNLANIYESMTQSISNKSNFINNPNESLYFYNSLISLSQLQLN